MMKWVGWWSCYCLFLVLLHCQTSISNESKWPEDCWTDIVSPTSKLVRRNMPFQVVIQCDNNVTIEQREYLLRSFAENKMQFCVVRDHDKIFLPCFPNSHLSYIPESDWILSLLPISNQSHCLSSNTLKFDEVCTNESTFSIQGFKSVTLPYITYVKEIRDNHIYRHNFAWAMFDLDTDRYLPTCLEREP